jgi:hypothetical protein
MPILEHYKKLSFIKNIKFSVLLVKPKIFWAILNTKYARRKSLIK